MGGYFSKSSASPQPTVIDPPWRRINWDDTMRDFQFVDNYQPAAHVERFRILLHGPVGAGKSSFINSVLTALHDSTHGSIHRDAFVGHSPSCVTKEYKTYSIEKGNSHTFYPFVLNDMMGLKNVHDRRSRRNHVNDVIMALKGHVEDGYTFNPERKLRKGDRFYRDDPTPNDQVHILVFVIDANTESMMKPEAVEVIQDIIDEAADLEIPHMAIFTKIDVACPEIKQDIKNVYKSGSLKKKVEHFKEMVGSPVNSIFPVQNYHSEIEPNNDIDTLILNALRNIIKYGDDCLRRRQKATADRMTQGICFNNA